jgi:hypothetical protein
MHVIQCRQAIEFFYVSNRNRIRARGAEQLQVRRVPNFFDLLNLNSMYTNEKI